MTQIPGTLGLTSEQVDGLLTTAGRASSLHNSRPWRFRVTPRLIELYADPERTLPVADPDGREQRMACGAALFNLRLALHGYGRSGRPSRSSRTALGPSCSRSSAMAARRNPRPSRRGCCSPYRL